MTALIFPLSRTDFFSTLKIRSTKFTLQEFILTSGTEDNIMTMELAAPKWACEIQTSAMTSLEARRAGALLRRIGAHGRFVVYDKTTPYPAYDPTGSISAGYTPQVAAIDPSNRAIAVKGLPPHYRLGWGDKLQINYGSAPVRRMLVEVNDDVETGPGGATPAFEVTPPLRPGILVDDAVNIRQPDCLMQFRSYDAGLSELWLPTGMTFQAVEVVT